MKIIPWRKQDELVTFRKEFDRLLERFMEPDLSMEWSSALQPILRSGMLPPVNMAEAEKAWTFSFELPGMNEKDIRVQLVGNTLVVSGERKWEEESKGKDYHRVESQFGTFQRSIVLPDNVRREPDLVNAKYTKGILEVTLPKLEATPALKIPVKAS